MTFTFESLVTPEGVAAVAAFIVVLIQLLKNFPRLFERITGAAWVILLSAALYAIGAIVMSPMDPNGYLGTFVAWATCATAAIGLYATANQGIQFTQPSATPPKNIGPGERFAEDTKPLAGDEPRPPIT